MSTPDTASLSAAFNTDLTDASVLTELRSLCNIYSLDPNNLFYKWEAFSLNNLQSTDSRDATDHPTLTIENVKLLRASLQREVDRDRRQKTAETPIKRDGGIGTNSARKQHTPSVGNL